MSSDGNDDDLEIMLNTHAPMQAQAIAQWGQRLICSKRIRTCCLCLIKDNNTECSVLFFDLKIFVAFPFFELNFMNEKITCYSINIDT